MFFSGWEKKRPFGPCSGDAPALKTFQVYSSELLGSVQKLLDLWDRRRKSGFLEWIFCLGTFLKVFWQSEQNKQNSPCWISPTSLLLQQTFRAKYQASWFHRCERRKQRQTDSLVWIKTHKMQKACKSSLISATHYLSDPAYEAFFALALPNASRSQIWD